MIHINRLHVGQKCEIKCHSFSTSSQRAEPATRGQINVNKNPLCNTLKLLHIINLWYPTHSRSYYETNGNNLRFWCIFYLTLHHLFPLKLMVFSVSWNNFYLQEKRVWPRCIKLWDVHDLLKVSFMLDNGWSVNQAIHDQSRQVSVNKICSRTQRTTQVD